MALFIVFVCSLAGGFGIGVAWERNRQAVRRFDKLWNEMQYPKTKE